LHFAVILLIGPKPEKSTKNSQTKTYHWQIGAFKAQSAEARGGPKVALRSHEKIYRDWKRKHAAADACLFPGVFYEKNRRFSLTIMMLTKVVKGWMDSSWCPQSVELCFPIAKKLQEGMRPRYF
jgi:hypothetical protein